MSTSAWSPLLRLIGVSPMTFRVSKPVEFAAWPFASGLPTVRRLDDCTGGAHDGTSNGAPGGGLGEPEMHCSYAGTRRKLEGDAPLGRAYPFAITWVLWLALLLVLEGSGSFAWA